ncbi:MAG TPA: PAS domain S-box protein [Spirochaetia bacterium]|nr:PAS domain S-box protein [Spirochaetia bacterium]
MPKDGKRKPVRKQRDPVEKASARIPPDHLRRIIENAPFALLIFDLDSLVIVAVNERLCGIADCLPADLVGRSVETVGLFEAAEFPPILRDLREKNGSSMPRLVTLRGPSSAKISLTLTSTVTENDGSRYAELFLSDRVLSAVRNADQGLSSLSASFMDSLPVGCQVIDRNWRYLYLNAEACRHGRIEVDNAVGRTMMECYPGIETTGLFEALTKSMNEQVPMRLENEFAYPDGTTNTFELSLFPSSNGLFVLSVDESERHHLDTVTSRLAAIVSSSDQAIIGKRLDGTITDWNLGAERLYGYTASEVVGKPISVLLPPDRKDELASILARIGRGERVENYDTVRLREDGSKVAVMLSVSPILDSEGVVVGASASAMDISARKEAERQAHESSERFETIARVIEDVFWMADAEIGEVYYVSPAFEVIWGRTRTELYENPRIFLDAVHPDDRDRVQADLRKHSQAHSFRHDFRVVRPDGSMRRVTQRGYAVFDDSGQFTRYVGIVQDISERYAAEEQIREQAELLDVASDIIIVTDIENHIRYWNRSAERTFGVLRDSALGTELFSIVPAAEDEVQLNEISAVVLSAGEWSGEIHPVRTDGAELTLSVRLTAILNEAGETKGIMAVATDVTERRAIERQLLRAQRMESLGALAGGIAHDLNNVLSPILMGVEGLSLKDPSPSVRKIIEIIRASALRGAEIVRQILGFARGVEGEHVEIQLLPILEEIRTITTETFPKSVEVAVAIEPRLWPVVGDSTQIHQVVMNICVNARDAMPEGGRLTVTVKNRELDETYARMHIDAKPIRYVVIEITDTGEGMPAAVVDKIFEPFYTTKPIGKGTGLGLSTALAIVKSHGGFINVYSELGTGTSFNIYIPAKIGSEQEEVDDSPEGIPMGSGELIIVVEDEAPIREIAREILESYGYRVVTAEDGTEALVAFLRERKEVGVILIDMMMPNLDGSATIRALRKIDPSLRIVATSGLVSSQQSTLAAGMGVNAFLPKPYTAETLLRTLHAVLGSEPNAPHDN